METESPSVQLYIYITIAGQLVAMNKSDQIWKIQAISYASLGEIKSFMNNGQLMSITALLGIINYQPLLFVNHSNPTSSNHHTFIWFLVNMYIIISFVNVCMSQLIMHFVIYNLAQQIKCSQLQLYACMHVKLAIYSHWFGYIQFLSISFSLLLLTCVLTASSQIEFRRIYDKTI